MTTKQQIEQIKEAQIRHFIVWRLPIIGLMSTLGVLSQLRKNKEVQS